MKKILIILSIAALGFGGWKLASPLFIDQVVDESLPFDLDAAMDSEKIEAMSESEKMEMEREIVEALAEEPAVFVNENMDAMLKEVEESDSKEPVLVSTGQFNGTDSFHKGSGLAKIYSTDGKNFLRFEDFSVTNGPDLRVYLSKEVNPDKNAVKNGLEIAKLKGNKGNQNYELPDSIEEYKSVVIYCKPFSVVFAIANLEK